VTAASYNCDMARHLTILVVLTGLTDAAGQNGRTPEALSAPAGERLAFQLHASGDQIYICRNRAWEFKAPEARLFDAAGHQAGKHFAGPIWQSSDGSQVKGKLVASAPGPDTNAIPWLLLTAVQHSGSGVMSPVTSIQRLHTKAGNAPKDSCDGAHEGTETRSPYQADYFFFVRAN